ncbi:nitric oxide synthase, salivary gland [Trichonephila clavipes]|nr:nitric oxide synthase, salivary gland [Trichonephila clavipes]
MRIALSRYLDITTPPGQQFLRTLATMAQDEGDQRKIKLLATDSVRYEDWKSHLYPNLLEVLEYFSSVEPTPGFLLTHLTPLQPRFYSISSAPEFHPEHIHLTVAVVIYKTQNESRVCFPNDHIHWCAKIKDEVKKLAYQLNEEAEWTERPIRRLSKVMYGGIYRRYAGRRNGGVSE